MRRVGAVTAVVVALVLVGCGPSDRGAGPAAADDGDARVEESTAGGVRLWSHRTAGDGAGDDAFVVGTLELDRPSGCLYLAYEEQRLPIIWPHGTRLAVHDPVRIELADGTEVELGMRLAGGGGYDAAAMYDLAFPDACLTSTREIARFNQQSAIDVSP
jgi:hypothetical protein